MVFDQVSSNSTDVEGRLGAAPSAVGMTGRGLEVVSVAGAWAAEAGQPHTVQLTITSPLTRQTIPVSRFSCVTIRSTGMFITL